jgi:hypothetical protein
MMLQIEKQRLPKWVAFRRLRISLFLQRARSQPTMAFFEENRVVKLLLRRRRAKKTVQIP